MVARAVGAVVLACVTLGVGGCNEAPEPVWLRPADEGATPTATASRTVEAQPYSARLTSELYSLQVDIEPAERGNNVLHLYAYDKSGKTTAVVEWRATAAMPSAGVEPIQIPLLKITENHSTGEIALPTAGPWQFQFTLRLSEIDEATVSATVPIR